MSDSQVMTNIFYYAGYDVLAEYNGGAVFVIADYRGKTPTVYMFKGCSKKDELSKEPEEERPLYFTQTKDSIIFSSLPDYLFTLFYKYKAYMIPPGSVSSESPPPYLPFPLRQFSWS